MTPVTPHDAPAVDVAVALRTEQVGEAADQPHRLPVRHGWLHEVALTALAGALSLTAAVFMLQLWRLDLHVPMYSGADIQLNMGVIKNVVHHGWFYRTSQLGAPYGQVLFDYRSFSGDSLNLIICKVLGLGTKDPAAITNLFIIVSYPLVATSAYCSARLIGIRRTAALVAAVVFACLPFHQSRNALHLFYTNYSAAPLALALAIRQAGPKPLLRRVPGARWRGLLHRDSVVAVLIVLVCATSGSYFGAFSCVFLAFAVVLALLRHRRAAAVATVVLVVALGAVMFLQTLPTTLYQRTHGKNDITVRSLVEFDLNALRPSQLVLPLIGHRIPWIRSWRDDLPLILPNEGSREAFGLFGAFGLLASGWLVVVQLVRQRTVHWARRLRDAPPMMFAAVSLSIFSGLDWIIGAFGFTQVRAWNRISVFVAFLCVAVTAVGLDRILQRRRWSMRGVVLSAVLILAVLDQSTSADVPSYARQSNEWKQQEAFVDAIEATLEPSAAVFELPIIDYPENPTVVALPDYAQLFGYLHSDDLRWSYGGVKGREAGWRHALDPLSPAFADELVATGFTGLTINLAAYEDHGAAVAAALASAGLEPTMSNSSMGGVVFYDLRSVATTDGLTSQQQDEIRDRLLPDL